MCMHFFAVFDERRDCRRKKKKRKEKHQTERNITVQKRKKGDERKDGPTVLFVVEEMCMFSFVAYLHAIKSRCNVIVEIFFSSLVFVGQKGEELLSFLSPFFSSSISI